jgi:hypothetical protein
MTSRQDARSLIKSNFPGHDSLIDRAYRESASFRVLCRDYRDCALALERRRRLDGAEASSETREYAELLAELASELASWLGALRIAAVPQHRGGAQ